jgi:hypothetical protein
MKIKRGWKLVENEAFTMIEIAIALGVIAFALVAIIGVLPVGLNVQKESNQDAIISQDGPFFLNAIGNGGPINASPSLGSFDFLTNYIDSITITNVINGIAQSGAVFTFPAGFSNGQSIIGLLSTPFIYGSRCHRGCAWHTGNDYGLRCHAACILWLAFCRPDAHRCSPSRLCSQFHGGICRRSWP